MLNSGKRRGSLAGKLVLSTALIAVSLAYGWWQRHTLAGPGIAVAPAPPGANRLAPVRSNSPMTARAEPTAPAAQATPGIGVTPGSRGVSGRTIAPPLTALAALRMYQPPPPQAPLPLVTGTPGATALIPSGTYLRDGAYLSDRQQYEWGDLMVRIAIHGGQITGVQVVQYPDHRSESLELSQMASPILDSEVIKTQQSNVDVVSSATDTSYAFRDAIASAITRATRW